MARRRGRFRLRRFETRASAGRAAGAQEADEVEVGGALVALWPGQLRGGGGRRQGAQGKVRQTVVDAVLDFHCRMARRHPIFFLWRPFLRDPRDEMALELAVKAGCEFILTFDERDFAGVEKWRCAKRTEPLGIRALPPAAFLREIGVLP